MVAENISRVTALVSVAEVDDGMVGSNCSREEKVLFPGLL